MSTTCSRRSSAVSPSTAARTSTAPRAPAPNILAIGLAAAALLAMLVRPLRGNAAWYGAGGALLLLLTGALPLRDGIDALARGVDVYLFLIGMMALAEYARAEGVFTWLAARAVGAAGGSPARLLLLVYGAGVITTALLSNDATIVVLTPAVIAAVARTDAAPEPYVFACAFVANAASLALPIANPSNLLFFARGLPPLGAWLGAFGIASVTAIVLTYAALAFVFRRELRGTFAVHDGDGAAPRPLAVAVLAAASVVLIVVASLGGPLGQTAFALGGAATALVALRDRAEAAEIGRGIAWPVVVLTAALFVIVEALDVAGGAALPRSLFGWAAQLSGPAGRLAVAGTTALVSNLATNLPVGLDVGSYVARAHPTAALGAAALVGVNVGPNLTVHGSLATLLWLAILQRAGIRVSRRRFAAIGLFVTPLALAGAALTVR